MSSRPYNIQNLSQYYLCYVRKITIDILLEIDATLPTTEEDCRLWTFFLNGEELSKETCLRIVHDHDARQSFQIMIT